MVLKTACRCLHTASIVSTQHASLLARPNRTLPKVAICLCTYNGQYFLADQLHSIEKQTYTSWEVWASDDGSKDDTFNILHSYKTQWDEEKLKITSGPRQGFAANFLALICLPEMNADYYAFADQDDIWEADKLQRALHFLSTIPPDTPALYCSRTRLVDANNQEIGLSPHFKKPPGFANALLQNMGGGNTMVFNRAARELLCEAGPSINVLTHDWWGYLVISGCGGKVFYDDYPSLRYRQHANNLVGMNTSWRACLVRIRLAWQGQFRLWNDKNIEALQRLQERLTPENREILAQFSSARQRWLLPRMLGFKRAGVHRQTLMGNLGSLFFMLLNKI